MIHGKRRTRVYYRWAQMIQRCYNSNDDQYFRYGGRGITCCKAWRNFVNFYADMGDPPERLSLERRNNEGGYWCGHCEECLAMNRPPNCYWATAVEQAVNRRSTHWIQYQNRRWTLRELAREFNLQEATLLRRLQRGISVEIAVSMQRYSRPENQA